MIAVSLEKVQFIIFALLRLLEAVREVLRQTRGVDQSATLASLDETSVKLVALAHDLDKLPIEADDIVGDGRVPGKTSRGRPS